MYSNVFLRVLTLLTLLGSIFVSSLATASLPPLATSYNLVSSQRVTRTQFDYTYTVTFSAGSAALKGVVAHVTSKSPATVIIDGDVNIGDVAANDLVTPPDTMILRQDRTIAFNPSDLVWTFTARPEVQVSVVVTDPGAVGASLSYRWRATDGDIVDVNSSTTTWTLPPGPGLHFAYVLVSNGRGGYTERRVAVNTDTGGIAAVLPPSGVYAAPPAPVPLTSARGFVFGGTRTDLTITRLFPLTFSSVLSVAFGTDVLVYLEDSTTPWVTYPPAGPAGAVKTDLRGQYLIPNVPLGLYNTNCSIDGGATWLGCGGISKNGTDAVDFLPEELYWTESRLVGRVRLDDNSVCGTRNEFFGVEASATASLWLHVPHLFGLPAFDLRLAGPNRVSADGDFFFRGNSGSSVVVDCEGASPVSYTSPFPAAVGNPIGDDLNINLGIKTFSGVKAPVIGDMTVSGGVGLVSAFLPPPSGPSDNVPDADRFLTYKGSDSRKSACQYYKAIGAVQNCDAQGNFTGAINSEDWKKTVKIGPYATPGTPEYAATYINQMDLNLTRRHHSISYGSGNTAAYVCNHKGPSVNPTQTEINAVIGNAVAGKDLIACVMMDHRVSPGVNGGQPFTRFMAFGPSGELLPSVNLDGRGEKFLPGACVACHGGDKHVGKFPENGSGSADLGAHFLPYDTGNFAFSNRPGLTGPEQEEAIYNLNQNVLKAGPTTAAKTLIAGWYKTSHVLNKAYVPQSWLDAGAANANIYKKVFAPHCRTCHVNLPNYDLDDYDTAATVQLDQSVCGSSRYQSRKYSMPNSLVTFNRFWSTKGAAEDLTKLMADFLGGGACEFGH